MRSTWHVVQKPSQIKLARSKLRRTSTYVDKRLWISVLSRELGPRSYRKVASSSLSWLVAHFQKAYEGVIWWLCTVNFGQKVPQLNSRPVYCSPLYGIHLKSNSLDRNFALLTNISLLKSKRVLQILNILKGPFNIRFKKKICVLGLGSNSWKW